MLLDEGEGVAVRHQAVEHEGVVGVDEEPLIGIGQRCREVNGVARLPKEAGYRWADISIVLKDKNELSSVSHPRRRIFWQAERRPPP